MGAVSSQGKSRAKALTWDRPGGGNKGQSGAAGARWDSHSARSRGRLSSVGMSHQPSPETPASDSSGNSCGITWDLRADEGRRQGHLRCWTPFGQQQWTQVLTTLLKTEKWQ